MVGDCIRLVPYDLDHKAKVLACNPEVILSGRRGNNSVPHFIAHKVLKMMIQHDQKINHSKVLILGVTFKETCPDVRNTKVVNIGREMEDFGCEVDYLDPWADKHEVMEEYGVTLLDQLDPKKDYQAIIACVAHDNFAEFDFLKYKNQGAVIFDVNGMLNRDIVDERL